MKTIHFQVVPRPSGECVITLAEDGRMHWIKLDELTAGEHHRWRELKGPNPAPDGMAKIPFAGTVGE